MKAVDVIDGYDGNQRYKGRMDAALYKKVDPEGPNVWSNFKFASSRARLIRQVAQWPSITRK